MSGKVRCEGMVKVTVPAHITSLENVGQHRCNSLSCFNLFNLSLIWLHSSHPRSVFLDTFVFFLLFLDNLRGPGGGG